MANTFMIYGANGYTGFLTARQAVQHGLHPILAGRNKAAIEAAAEQLDLEARVFTLDNPDAIDTALKDVDVVIHAAGPFRMTYQQMAEACLRTGTHYVDITGEPDVFEALQAMDAAAKEAGVMLLPGAGMDVVPSDCLARHLKERLPGATHLSLAFRQIGPAQFSHGTANTFIINLSDSAFARQNGKIVNVPHLSKTRMVDFGRGEKKGTRMTWGDVFTAYHSTGIPNIENYFVLYPLTLSLLALSRYFRPLVKTKVVQNLLVRLSKIILPPGPSDEAIEKSQIIFWGEAKDDAGNTVVSRLRTPEGYYLTALTSLLAAQRVMAGDAPAGYQTPSSAYGADFIMEIEGVTREDVN